MGPKNEVLGANRRNYEQFPRDEDEILKRDQDKVARKIDGKSGFTVTINRKQELRYVTMGHPAGENWKLELQRVIRAIDAGVACNLFSVVEKGDKIHSEIRSACDNVVFL